MDIILPLLDTAAYNGDRHDPTPYTGLDLATFIVIGAVFVIVGLSIIGSLIASRRRA